MFVVNAQLKLLELSFYILIFAKLYEVINCVLYNGYRIVIASWSEQSFEEKILHLLSND